MKFLRLFSSPLATRKDLKSVASVPREKNHEAFLETKMDLCETTKHREGCLSVAGIFRFSIIDVNAR